MVLNQDSITSGFGYSIIKRPRLNTDSILKTRIQVARQEINTVKGRFARGGPFRRTR
jgi:hypothetical protein